LWCDAARACNAPLSGAEKTGNRFLAGKLRLGFGSVARKSV